MSRVRVGVLASGSGTNLQALLDATADPSHPAQVVVVGSDRPGAVALTRAERAGVPTFVTKRRDHPDRASFDRALAHALRAHRVEWVCLAGFMRLVGPELLEAFPDRLLNIHPALLPAFPGLHAQEQAWRHGVRLAGCTVHLVDAGTDTGPIVAQGAVPVLPTDDLATLSARILRMEHRLYPKVLTWAAEGRLAVQDGRVALDLSPGESPTLFDPSP